MRLCTRQQILEQRKFTILIGTDDRRGVQFGELKLEQTAGAAGGAMASVRILNAAGAQLARRDLDIPRLQLAGSEWDSVMTAWSTFWPR